jgi:hypothetical protein
VEASTAREMSALTLTTDVHRGLMSGAAQGTYLRAHAPVNPTFRVNEPNSTTSVSDHRHCQGFASSHLRLTRSCDHLRRPTQLDPSSGSSRFEPYACPDSTKRSASPTVNAYYFRSLEATPTIVYRFTKPCLQPLTLILEHTVCLSLSNAAAAGPNAERGLWAPITHQGRRISA